MKVWTLFLLQTPVREPLSSHVRLNAMCDPVDHISTSFLANISILEPCPIVSLLHRSRDTKQPIIELPETIILESLRLHCCVCSSSLISRRLQLIKKNQRSCEATAFCHKTSETIDLTFFLTCFSGNKYSAGIQFLYFTFNWLAIDCTFPLLFLILLIWYSRLCELWVGSFSFCELSIVF